MMDMCVCVSGELPLDDLFRLSCNMDCIVNPSMPTAAADDGASIRTVCQSSLMMHVIRYCFNDAGLSTATCTAYCRRKITSEV